MAGQTDNHSQDWTKLSYFAWLKIAVVIVGAVFLVYRCFLPFCAEYVFREAYNFEARQNWTGAVQKYRQAWKFAPWETYYLTGLGRIYENQARAAATAEEKLALTKQAEEVYDWCLKISPTNPWYVIRKGEIYGLYAEMESDPQKKMDLLQQREEKILVAAELDKNNAIFQMSAGNIYLGKNDYAKAQEYYDHSLIIDDRTGEAYLRLAEIAAVRRENARQREIAEAWLSKIPDDINAHLYLGQLYDAAGQNGEALQLYKNAAQLDKSSETAFRLLGSACYRAQEWRNMEIAYNRLTAIQPGNADYYVYKAQAQIRQAKMREALSALETALTLRPGDANIQNSINTVKAQIK
ncbi:hypothetical protein NO2_0557 [Candidatus Termititenax persephonae]|uniref:Uncharacterized protein n=1 Tax=Candidatus Termititenax persephonae TaxID=2218525 RepID=A0A388TGC9_9BACT|nr:hypothetical protein NO2_0557 [Candidatus Termititenax persephonae]